MSKLIHSFQIEGVDGSGKGLIIDNLSKRFEKNYDIVYFKFPGGLLNKVDYEYIRNLCKSDEYYSDGISSYLNLCSMISNVSYEQSKINKPTIFIYDRFYLSCLVYDIYKTNPVGQQFLIDHIKDYINIYTDYTIVCTPDTQLCVDNNLNKDDMEKERELSTNLEKLNMLNDSYKKISNLYFNNAIFIDTFHKSFDENIKSHLDEIESNMISQV